MTTAEAATLWAHALSFGPMTVDAARRIADGWKYPTPYDFYDATADAEDYAEFVMPARWPDRFWQVRQGDDLEGFFTAATTDDGACEISLGLRPDLTGSGRGLSFLRRGLELLDAELSPTRVKLSVAAFNHRAVKVYEAAGFIFVRRHAQHTNGSTFDFVDMELHRRE